MATRDSFYRAKNPANGLSAGEEGAIKAYSETPGITKGAAFLVGHPHGKRWTRLTINQRASDMFKRPHVVVALNKIWEKRAGRIADRRERVIMGFEKLAFTDLPGIIDYEKGEITISDFKTLSPAERSCIKEFKVKTVKEIVNDKPHAISEVSIKLHDKPAALANLARIEGMFNDKLEVTNSANCSPAQVIADMLGLATDEERAVIEAMAVRLTGQELPSGEVV